VLGFSLGRKQAVWVVLLALVGFCVPTPEPTAAAPRECGYESLEPEFPEYARAGGMIEIPVSDYSAGEDEFTGSVEVTPLGGESRTYPLELIGMRETPYGLDGRIAVPAPARRNRATRVVLTWIEQATIGPGYVTECVGGEAATIPVVPAGGEVGDPSVPRLEGRFRMSIQVEAAGIPVADRFDRPVWRFRPLCRYFGCSSKLSSTLGLRDTFFTAGFTRHHDYYAYRYFGRRGFCAGTVYNRFTGQTTGHWKIRRAYKATRETWLRVTDETSEGRAAALEGKHVLHIEPIASAERRGCPDKYVVERIRGRLIQS